MFSKVSAEEIQEFLEENTWQYFDELEELEDLMDDEDCKFLASDDMYIMTNPGDTIEVWAIPTKKDFDLAAFENWLNRYNEFRVHMNVSGLNPGSFRYQEYYEVSDEIKSYYAKGESDLTWASEIEGTSLGAELQGSIRLLSAKDEKLARNFFQAETRGVMDLGQVFAFIVKDELGKILGYFDEEGKLVAYLSVMYGFNDVLVVDDLYVLSSRRKKGVASSLAKALISVAQNENMDVYWPVAETELAQKTAKAAGYQEVASRITIQNL